MAAVIGLGGWSVLRGFIDGGWIGRVLHVFDAAVRTVKRSRGDLRAGAEDVHQYPPTAGRIGVGSPLSRLAHPAIRFPQNRRGRSRSPTCTFGYPNTGGLLSIPHLNIRAGEQVAIVGENGAGKSTLAKLLVRLYDADAGSILVAGHDVRKIEIESLREHVCYAPPYPIAVRHDTAPAIYGWAKQPPRTLNSRQRWRTSDSRLGSQHYKSGLISRSAPEELAYRAVNASAWGWRERFCSTRAF